MLFRSDAELKFKNLATPYTINYRGELSILPFDKWDNLGPAAGIISNLNDMEKWLRFQLDSGKVNGNTLLPWAVLEYTRKARAIISSRYNSDHKTHFEAYGMGLFMCDFNGNKVYWHTGGASGMVSNVCFEIGRAHV